jgi:DNA-binding transcriptional regulator LsrR (DeoR family)
MVAAVIAELVNNGLDTDRQIATATGISRVLVEHILDMLEANGLVRLTKTTGPNTRVFDVSPQLRRMLAEGM